MWYPFMDLPSVFVDPTNIKQKVFIVPYVTYHAPFQVADFSPCTGTRPQLIKFKVACPVQGADRVE